MEQLERSRRDFDADALREKYRQEREKRLRADGNRQYVEMGGRFASYLDDPYTEPFERAPLHDETEVILIGGGFGGLLAGARLREAGFTDIRIIEKGGDFGGTWYWNRYPGAACDVESYIYLPLLEEMGFMPRRKYTPAPEILDYSRRIAERFDLYRNACLQTMVTELRWDGASRRWIVSTNRGDRMRARFVAMANGPAHKPKLPGIPGLEAFKGHTFHTSRWDYDYTGGGPDGGLDRLSDKVIGVIGTGATAIQCIPHLGEAAKRLYVFQRTPSSVDVRDDRPTDLDWWKSLTPGWQKARMENFTTIVAGGQAEVDLINDGWTDVLTRFLRKETLAGLEGSEHAASDAVELADFAKMEEIRARVATVVKDPATAEALKPYYRQFCKRPCFHDAYLPTFNRPNVSLIDTDGKGVERITERGVIAAGVEYPLDGLVFATGFEIGTSYTGRSGYDVVGAGGLRLSQKWAKGISSLHGMHVHGFPNLFIFMRDQSAHTVNFTHSLDEQSKHLAYILRAAKDRNAVRMEATRDAEDAWVETIIELAQLNQEFLERCTPGYYNGEGQINAEAAKRNAGYGRGPGAFFDVLDDWRNDGRLAGLTLEPRGAGS
ncbi:NAD(P)/FAD-dependent oxidoreductase [Phenylobacterium sp. LjRoot225]|uniref:flavin-containing monooxygenase n=1 Tax=Phenylobacterium sp. LjRoot225 TaxID=3342285 RepID=UPI003ECFD3E5